MIDRNTFAQYVLAAGINDCWFYIGPELLSINGAYESPARACLLFHGVDIARKKVTHACGHSDCVNLKHLRVNGQPIYHVIPKLFWLTPEERFLYHIVESKNGCCNYHGPKRARRKGLELNPKVYYLQILGLTGYKAKAITTSCWNSQCFGLKHLLADGVPVPELIKANVPPLDAAALFKQYIREVPRGCHIWTGCYATNGEPQYWTTLKYINANAAYAEHLGLPFVPPGGKRGRTCRNIHCVHPKHFVDLRNPDQKFRDNIKEVPGDLPTPCQIWLPKVRYDYWEPYLLNKRPPKRISIERFSLYRHARAFYDGKIHHRCHTEGCICPEHLYLSEKGDPIYMLLGN